MNNFPIKPTHRLMSMDNHLADITIFKGSILDAEFINYNLLPMSVKDLDSLQKWLDRKSVV